MSALFMDSFDFYGTGLTGSANMIEGAWAERQTSTGTGPGIPAWGPRTGNLALAAQAGSQVFRWVLPSGKPIVYFSCGFACDGLPTIDFRNQIVSFRDASNVTLVNLWVQSSGAIQLTDNAGNILGATQGPVIVSRNWHFLEMELDKTDGTFTLRVDDATGAGSAAMAVTGLSLSGNIGQVGIGGGSPSGGGVPVWYDDYFMRDGDGSINNGWLGDRRVATLLANGDTTTAGWTPNYYHKIGAGILNNTANGSPPPAVLGTTATSLNLGSGDFTIEQFVRFQALPTGSNKSTIFCKWDEAANQRSYELFLGSVGLNNGSLCFQTSTDGTVSSVAQPIIYPFTPTLDVWYHMAVVRASGELLLFVNGQQLGLPIADSNLYFVGSASVGLGGQPVSTSGPGTPTFAGASLQGWLDEVRLTVGFARYTSNFTPTTIAFPRGTSDPEWSDVTLLVGFDSIIQDESSFNQTLSAKGGSVQFTTNDGASVGAFSTIGKPSPDDNTFISAPFVAATSILTLTVNANNNNTVTVGTTDGTTAAVYTFKTSLTGSAFEVLVDTSIQNSLQNLYNAINTGPGVGTKYGTGTTANFDVNASQLPAGQMQVSANVAGTGGNVIATSATGITGSWTGSTLSGGLSIPGPSNFKVQRLPPTTTIVSAVQVSVRAFKSDAGLGSINTALVGPLGGVDTGATHALAVSPIYYNDIYESDPDTSGPISPTTIAGGAIQINRDT